MGANSSIEWTDHTFNPWIGCFKVSPGCKNCYASVNTFTRFQRSKGRELWGPPGTTERHVTSDAKWREPRRWNDDAGARGVRARVFCASMADVFEDHPQVAEWRSALWDMIEGTPHLDWQLLTKRPENVESMVPEHWRGGFPPNVWLGTCVEDQARADERIPELLRAPAAVRFLSCEPLLGPVDLSGFFMVPAVDRDSFDSPIDWVIAGGESGPGARRCELTWLRSIRDQSREADVPVFVKQVGARAIATGSDWLGRRIQHDVEGLSERYALRLVDRKGGDMAEWPEDLRVREFPERRAS